MLWILLGFNLYVPISVYVKTGDIKKSLIAELRSIAGQIILAVGVLCFGFLG